MVNKQCLALIANLLIMKHISILLHILLSAGLVGLIVAATAQKSQPKATLFGRWEWVSTRVNGETTLAADAREESTVLVYKPDSTVDQYRNHVRVVKDRPFSVCRKPHPAGTGVVDVMLAADETGMVEPYQTVWLKSVESDTLVFMGLNPSNRFRPGVYSVFRRIQ
jgi:hypothetical protein